MSTLLCSFPTEKGGKLDTRTVPSLPWTCHGGKCPFNAMHLSPRADRPDVSESQCHAPIESDWLTSCQGVYSWSTHLAWALGMSVKWTERQLLGLENRGTKKKMVNVLENTLASCIQKQRRTCVSSFLHLFSF